jgi:hypothetical protein
MPWSKAWDTYLEVVVERARLVTLHEHQLQ